jgi:hypothetical protein
MITSRRMGWVEHVACTWQNKNAYMVFVGKREGKRLLGRPRRIWTDNIMMDPTEIGWEGMDWIHLA